MSTHPPPLFLDRTVFKGRVTWLTTTFVIGALFAAGSLATFWRAGEPTFLTTAFFLSLGAMIVPLGVKIGHAMLQALARQLDVFLVPVEGGEKAGSWFLGAMAKRLRQMGVVYAAAAAFGVLSLVAFAKGGVLEFSDTGEAGWNWLRIQMVATVALGGFMSGSGLALMVMMGSLIWELDRFQVRLAPHPFGVCVIGQTLLKIYAMIAVIWLVFSSSAIVGLREAEVPLSALAGLSLVMFVVSFPLCLLPVHNRMIAEKQRLVVNAYARLEKLAEVDLKQRDEDHLRRYAEARREYQEALDLPEWPFGWKALAALTTSGLVSNLPALVGFLGKSVFE